MKTKMIKVWRFEDAPKKYQKLSQNGGDEDWIALVPQCMANDWIGWLEEGTIFGCCCVHQYTLKNGDVIRIGCHA